MIRELAPLLWAAQPFEHDGQCGFALVVAERRKDRLEHADAEFHPHAAPPLRSARLPLRADRALVPALVVERSGHAGERTVAGQLCEPNEILVHAFEFGAADWSDPVDRGFPDQAA